MRLLFVGDDWAEDHHDVELMDETGRWLSKARLPEGMAGMTRLHAMIGEQVGEDEDVRVVVGIEIDHGPWVGALLAADYEVYAINPLQVARFRERYSVSGAKSDGGDAHLLADVVRTERHQLRPVAGDSDQAEAVKVLTRAHKTLVWERTRHTSRLRHALREFFPAALVAFDDLAAPDTLELLALAPEPTSAAALSIEQVSAALKRARRRDIPTKAEQIVAALGSEQLRQPDAVSAAYAAMVRAQAAILATLTAEIKTLEKQVGKNFGQHPDAEIYLTQPGLGVKLAARVLAEFGDDKTRYADARARKNYAGTSPITRRSGKSNTCWPATSTTTAWSTPWSCKPSPRCAPHPAPGATTTGSAPAAWATVPRCANSATAWSASCTAASKQPQSMTNTSLGRITKKIFKLPLDN